MPFSFESFIEQCEKTIDHLQHDIGGLRTGRATPALVEDVLVEAYGTKQQLKALASIAVSDAKTITVEPWDKSILQSIEIGIRNHSGLGLSPVNDGKLLRLFLPELTTERRQELIKVLHQKLEQAKIAIRKSREDARDAILAAEKAKEIGADERYSLQERIDELVKEYNGSIQKIGEEKEGEIVKI